MTTDSKYVVVELSGDDLYAQLYEYYEEALAYVEESDNKAYIIRIEDFCADAHPPAIRITLEPHT